MVDPFGNDTAPPSGEGAMRARSELEARFKHVGDSHPGSTVGLEAEPTKGPSQSDFRAQASQAATEAKSMASSIADQARARLSEIVDQQKAAGADRLTGVAKAAASAAKDLDGSNPELARLVRSAADQVDRVAADVRGRDLGDVLDTMASFGRRQPVAFFGGAVLAGFLVARFFKSDAPVVAGVEPDRGPA